MNKVCIIGSINMDMVMDIEKMPKEGETILSNRLKLFSGGKGSNQVIAAKRSGADVSMIARIGNDGNGKELYSKLKSEGVHIGGITIDKNSSTGVAAIIVDSKGNNSIIVNSGANMKLTVEDIRKNKNLIEKSDIVVTQMETPVKCAIEGFKIGKDKNKITILNPAPAPKEIKEELLKLTDIVTPNETEAEILTGIKVETDEDLKKAGKVLIKNGVKVIIFTLGKRGVAIVTKDKFKIIKGRKVDVVDTTGAGDTFIGAFSSELKSLNFEDILDAANFANIASSISVTKKGAEPSIPYREEIAKA